MNFFVSRWRFSRKQSRHKQKSQGANHLGRCRVKDIGQAHIHATGAHSNCVMESGVRIKTNLDICDTETKPPTLGIQVVKRVAEDSLQVQMVLGHNRLADARILWATAIRVK